MENKQTAIEWLEEKINLYNFQVGMGSMRKYIEYAKTMEKEQIKDAFDNGYSYDLFNGGGKQYYEENYGTQLPKE